MLDLIEIATINQQIAQGNPPRPRATCLSGEITAMRPFDATVAATPENTVLIQHDIPTTSGTSGSALFDAFGSVVGVHSSRTLDDVGSNRFGVRADELVLLLGYVRRGELSPLPIVVQSFCPGYLGTPSSLADSDGDGWSDSSEYNRVPGSDPCDSADTQNTPIDSDSDGCSDFDEVQFTNQCDENPFTPVSPGDYPCALYAAAPDCNLICVSLGPSAINTLCDSDCDGWFDDVEIDAGLDPCSGTSPGYPPTVRTTVCVDALLVPACR